MKQPQLCYGEAMSGLPLLTMTKSRITGDKPSFSQDSKSLLDTLSTLCSFHSSNDLASFLFTNKFRDLVGTGEPWIVFEIGLYKDHTKTLEIIPVHDGITFADAAMTGAIQNHVAVVKSQSECDTILSNWYNWVMSG